MFKNLNSLVPNYCVSQFGEDTNDLECANLLDFAVLAPYVELTFLKFGTVLFNNVEQKFSISVGNNSSPLLNNTASIQSFTYSAGQGNTAVFEIIDTDAGNFTQIFRSIQGINCKKKDDVNKSSNAATSDLSWDWGWIGADDQGNSRLIVASSSRKAVIPGCGEGINVKNNKCFGTLNDIKVSIDSKSGLFKYTITAMDVVQTKFQPTKIETVFGKEEAPMKLKDAMKAAMTGLCGEAGNTNPDINFILARLTKDGKLDCESFKPKDGGKGGPSGVWPAMGLSAHDAVTEWKNNFVSANGKGSIHGVIPTDPPTLILTTLPENVDPANNDNENGNGKAKANANVKNKTVLKVYTSYIVNGGNNSPVISFDPKFAYVQLAGQVGGGGNAGGGIGPPQGVGQGPNQNDVATVPGQDVSNVPERSGPQVRIPARYYDTYNTSPTNVLQQKAASYLTQAKTMGIVENLTGYEADLTIQGDPVRYADFWTKCAFQNVGIIFINPFQLSRKQQNDNDGGYADFRWIAPDVCNKLLTRVMNIKAITHNINGGKYTTILKLVDVWMSTEKQKDNIAKKQ